VNRNSSPNEEPDQTRLARLLRIRSIESPFRGMSRNQVDASLAALGAENKLVFDRTLAQLRSSMLTTDPVRLLSILAVYGLFRPEGADPELEEVQPHLQLHFELVHALALMHEQAEYGFAIAVPPALVQETFDLFKQVAESFSLKGLAVASTPKTEQDRSRLVSQAAIRAHTIAFRNAGYPSQLKRLSTELVGPLDDACQAETGLGLTSLLEFLWNVIALIETRYNEDLGKWPACSLP
jgi:hypothetical protein